jgi:hypothetical protein
MTVRSASLTVSAASTPVAQTFIQGSQGVSLAGISLKAGQGSDVKVTAMTVQMRVDSNNDATFANGCENGIDTGSTDKLSTDILLSAKLMNGTTQVGDIKSPTSSTASCASADGGLLQFSNMNLTVPAGQTVTLSLEGTLAGSISNLNDTIDFTVANSDVTAQDIDGNTVSKSGSANSADMIISTSGTMTYALAPDDVESEAGLVLGGTTAVLAKYRFTAQTEDLKLAKVRFRVTDSGTTSATVAAVNSLSLYDGSALVAGPVSPSSEGFADFSAFSFVVPKDSSKTLTVKGALNQVSPSGVASGLNVQVTLCSGSNIEYCRPTGSTVNDPDGTYEVRGTSAGSSTLDTVGNSGNLDGREKRLRKTKPTVSDTSVPTSTLSNGSMVLKGFTIAADAAQQVSVKAIGFEHNLNNVSGTALSITSPTIREVGIGTDISASTTDAVLNCTGSATCSYVITFSTEQTIAAGASKSYQLWATVAGADASGESISTKLLGDTAQVTGEIDSSNAVSGDVPHGIDDHDGTAADGAYRFIWSDNSVIPHNDSTDTGNGDNSAVSASNDWTNGRHVKILPTNAQTLTRS